MSEEGHFVSPGAPTIVNVAKLAGTSTATVSRVLNQTDYPVSEATRKRVLKAAQDLNYTPNLVSKMLKTKSGKTLGIIIPSFQNPFFIQLTMGIEQAARSNGYSTFVFSSQRDRRIERRLITQVMQLRISGLLLSSIDHKSDALDSYLASGAVAAVFEAEYPLNSAVIDATPHMDENGYLATSHLLDSGHRQIAFLTTPLKRHNRTMVCKGFRQAMEDRGIPVEPQDIFESHAERELDDGLYEFEAGKELARDILACGRAYTAIVAVNDLLACGIVHQLVKAGVRVPEDISVVGIDDIPQSAMISPALSTVNQQSYQHGHDVCLHLIERLKDNRVVHGERCYKAPKMVERESVLKL
ncbi:MAG: LacI family DNA-binding transcriptional regulator [Clostridia bacterium]|nr:LacI family DNA-binding transcriptional regulator [Clostridia bacterium]